MIVKLIELIQKDKKENSRLNNEIAKEVFFEFPSEIISMPSDMSDSEKSKLFNIIISK